MGARLLFVLCLGFAVPVVAQGQAAPAAGNFAYGRAIDRAVQEFDLGHYAEARAAFREAHALSPSARTLRGLAKAEFELRNYRECVDYLRRALRSEVRPLTGGLRQDAVALLRRAEVYVARYRLELSPADAQVRVDGRPLRADCRTGASDCVALTGEGELVLEVGDHTLGVRSVGYEETLRELRVTGREDGTLRITLRPLPAGGAQADAEAAMDEEGGWGSGWTWTVIGVGVAAVATTAIVLGLGGETRTRSPEPSTVEGWDDITAAPRGTLRW